MILFQLIKLSGEFYRGPGRGNISAGNSLQFYNFLRYQVKYLIIKTRFILDGWKIVLSREGRWHEFSLFSII